MHRPRVVQRQAPVPGLDAAEGGGPEVAALGQLVERPAPLGPQRPDPLPDAVLEVEAVRVVVGRRGVLLHWQEAMRFTPGSLP